MQPSTPTPSDPRSARATPHDGTTRHANDGSEGRRQTELDIAQLLEVTIALASTMDERSIAEIVIGMAHDHIAAAASVAYFADPTDGELRMAAARNLPDSVRTGRATMPVDAPLPLAMAIRTGAPVWLDSRDAILRAFPDLVRSAVPASELQSVAAVPLLMEGRVLGGLGFSFDHAGVLTPLRRDYLQTLASQCAQAVARARLYAGERAAHARLTVLAEASQRFALAEQDLPTTLDAITREVATRLPDACAILLLGVDGQTLELAAVHHLDPEVQASIVAVLTAAPVRLGDPSVVAQVAATGRPMLVAPPAQVTSPRSEHQAHLERFPVQSVMVAPMAAADRILGVITASRSVGRPPYTRDDLALLVELAARAAPVIDNARLMERLTRTLRFAEQFVGILGHDLRNPLNSIGLATDALLSEVPDPRVTRTLLRIRSSADRMERMVEQLLDLTRARVGGGIRVEPVPANLAELTRQTIDELEPTASRPIEASVAGDPTGTWDADRLAQVLSNLVANAIQHGDGGSPVRITVDGHQPDRVVVTIANGGVIPSTVMPILFEPFRSGRRDRSRGLGLGLFISQQIVLAHGGQMSVTSTQEQGTSFAIALPRTSARSVP